MKAFTLLSLSAATAAALSTTGAAVQQHARTASTCSFAAKLALPRRTTLAGPTLHGTYDEAASARRTGRRRAMHPVMQVDEPPVEGSAVAPVTPTLRSRAASAGGAYAVPSMVRSGLIVAQEHLASLFINVVEL